MNSFSKAAGLSLLAVAVLSGCAQQTTPTPVTVTTEPSPMSSFHVSQVGKSAKDLQTGWVQDGNSVQLSLSGPDNCLPQIDHVVADRGTVSLYLKDHPSNCSSKVVPTYFTVDNAPDTQMVQFYEFGYDTPVELRHAS